MARNSREVKVLITGDASKLTKAIGDVESRAGKLGGVLKGALVGVSFAAIGRGIMNVANDFEDAALSAQNFATASGLSVEQASRWQEVAGDLGIESGKLESSLLKMSKTMSKDVHKWEDYGIAVEQANDGTIDMNKTFKNAITAIGQISDPLERAQIGSELFGKSWADLAPLVELSAEDVQKALDSVGDAQVIDENEVEKAKKFRDTMDNLNDSVGGLKLELAEGLIPAISTLAGWVSTLDPKMVTLGVSIAGVVFVVGKLSSAIMGVNGLLTLFATHPVFIAVVGIIAAITLIALNWDKVTAAINRAIAATDQFFAKNLGNPINSVLNKIPGVNIGGSQVQLTDKARQILANKAAGKATGGPVSAGVPYMIGERGPELFWPRTSGTIIPNHQLGGETIIHVHPAPGMSERDLARAVKREEDRARRGVGLAAV